MSERAPQEFDQYAPAYEAVIDDYVAFSGQSQDFYTRAKASHLQRIIEDRRGAATLDVLDIGCGHGLIHPYLNGPGFRLSGIDVAASALEQARQLNPNVTYDAYDGERLPYPNESFDIAFTICVLHHVPVPNWGAFLGEAWRVLRPGGTFVIFEHNKINPLVQWVVSRIPFDRNAVLLTSWHAQKLLRAAGFEQVKCSHILFFPFESPRLQKFENNLSWLPMGAQYYVTGLKPQSGS
jgi:SAM-dependent methyltransferase